MSAAEAALRWLARRPNLELSFSAWDEEPKWQVHRVTGSRSDREWTLIGEAATPLEALQSAMRQTGARRDD